MEEFVETEHTHTRYNPLNGQWVLVCPHRMKRPWLGQIEPTEEEVIQEFDPTNPLCPGTTRPNGEVNPAYSSTFVFSNDFPALVPDIPSPPENDTSDPLFVSGPAQGTCRVMCFHPKSNITLPLMNVSEIVTVIEKWIEQLSDLGSKFSWVQIFENKGASMGCSNPHPHCQIWATSFIPNEPFSKDQHQLAYYKKHGRPMLVDYANREIAKKQRIVTQNKDWLVVVPYWAVWPFETMLLPKTHIKRLTDVTTIQQKSLAEIIKTLTTKYDNLFKCSFPYTMGWHGAPTGPHLTNPCEHWTLHALYYPPLLRSASVRKFMVGFELLCQSQRDLTPEQAAARLMDMPEIHYKNSRDMFETQT